MPPTARFHFIVVHPNVCSLLLFFARVQPFFIGGPRESCDKIHVKTPASAGASAHEGGTAGKRVARSCRAKVPVEAKVVCLSTYLLAGGFGLVVRSMSRSQQQSASRRVSARLREAISGTDLLAAIKPDENSFCKPVADQTAGDLVVWRLVGG